MGSCSIVRYCCTDFLKISGSLKGVDTHRYTLRILTEDQHDPVGVIHDNTHFKNVFLCAGRTLRDNIRCLYYVNYMLHFDMNRAVISCW